MRFALVIVEDEEARQAVSPAEVEFDSLVRWWADLRLRTKVVASARRAPKGTARTVSWRQGSPLVTDGPFIEAKESVAGILIVEVSNEAEAMELAQSWLAKEGFKIEVRAVEAVPGE